MTRQEIKIGFIFLLGSWLAVALQAPRQAIFLPLIFSFFPLFIFALLLEELEEIEEKFYLEKIIAHAEEIKKSLT